MNSALFIDGKSVPTDESTPIYDPARTDHIVGFAAKASAAHVDTAIAAADRAAASWGALSFVDRRRVLTEAIVGIPGIHDATAELLTREIGKTLHESWVDVKVFEIRWNLAMGIVDDAALEAVIEPGAHAPNRTVVQRRPVGPVTIIIPFNWPLAILAASLPQALLAGNPVIVKVPATAPLATAQFVASVAAKLPAGVLNIISGEDATVQPLIDDPRIAHVCFTGSVNGGKAIARLAATNLTGVTMELGGNDAAIVLDDADLSPVALDRMFAAIFDTTGQICMNIKRLYVHESRMDELLDGLRSRLRDVRLGHGLDAATTHGPLHSETQAKFVRDLITEAVESGAAIEQFGEIPAKLSPERFVLPTIVIDPASSARIVTEEQFGPVIPVMSFANDEDAVAAANDTWAGLGASVWSCEPEHANAVANQLHVGYVWLNDHGAPRLDLRAPFGGVKSSGFGREQGIEGFMEFTETRAISTYTGDE